MSTDIPAPALGAAVRQPPAAAQPAALQLSERERQLINDLRKIDFWRAGREHGAQIHWSGNRLRVFDQTQIG